MTDVRLFTPGPTPVPPEVREAEGRPMIHHRSEEFSAILRAVRGDLVALCEAEETVILASSGTGGMEAVVASAFGPGERVLVVEGGKFGERWVELADQYGLAADVLRVPWGRAVAPEAVAERVTPSTRGVFLQACESSTGAYHPIDRIGALLPERDDLLYAVDAITAVGVHDLSLARHRIDFLIGASQKALMSPPGLAFVALSGRALRQLKKVASRSYYLSLQRELSASAKGQTAFTPAVSLVRALEAALRRISAEGKGAVFARHRALKSRARAAFREMGLSLFNRDDEAADGLTVVTAPPGLDVKGWLRSLKERHGLWLAGGQGELEGKIFRVAHMGAVTADDLEGALSTIRESLGGGRP
jgi:aspartate aminotransferase-like enzyme